MAKFSFFSLIGNSLSIIMFIGSFLKNYGNGQIVLGSTFSYEEIV